MQMSEIVGFPLMGSLMGSIVEKRNNFLKNQSSVFLEKPDL